MNAKFLWDDLDIFSGRIGVNIPNLLFTMGNCANIALHSKCFNLSHMSLCVIGSQSKSLGAYYILLSTGVGQI